MIIALAGFTTGMTTVLFGFGGGFVVVPFVYQLLVRQPPLASDAMHIAVATSTAVMIFNAGWVSFQNWRAGRLSLPILFPLLWFIAVGAVAGSWLAGILSEVLIRELFIFYMLMTIGDCLLRKGFFSGNAPRRLSLLTVTGGGMLIGTIAEDYFIAHPEKMGEAISIYLANHPEFLVAASENLRQSQQAAAQKMKEMQDAAKKAQ